MKGEMLAFLFGLGSLIGVALGLAWLIGYIMGGQHMRDRFKLQQPRGVNRDPRGD